MNPIPYKINSTQQLIFFGSDENYQSLVDLIESNIKLVETYFSSKTAINMQIIQNVNHKNPSFSSTGSGPTIRLVASNNYAYAQYVFQFSHELCHAQIRKDGDDSLSLRDTWFEEVICEVSSRFFLNKMSADENLNRSLYPHPAFKDYALNRTSEIEIVDLVVLSNEESHLLNMFRSEVENGTYANDETRSRYNYIANFIYPIFEENPELWQEVYLIHNFSNEKGFIENLISWKNESQRDENKKSIQKIINLFGNN